MLEDGELGVRPLRTAEATDRFVLSGGVDPFEPTFTLHGFRYAEVEGWPGEVTPDSLEAVVVYSELRRTGSFECSDPLINRMHSNIVWGLKGNFLDVPTDCPQRDERLGWTGDLAVFAPTAAFLYDVADFLGDWLLDLSYEQQRQGFVPFVVPDALKYVEMPPEFPDPDGTAVWSDAAVWVPWALWQAYGDWLDPTAPPDEPFKAKADNGVVATACLHRTARTVAEVAALTGRERDAEEFTALADGTREAFAKHYLHDDGTIQSDAPTAYALAIVFGLLDDAYRLLTEKSCPSWLYSVTMGATTVWERWDSMLPDGSINPGEMTSFNH